LKPAKPAEFFSACPHYKGTDTPDWIKIPVWCLRRKPLIVMVMTVHDHINPKLIQDTPQLSYFRVVSVPPGAKEWMVPVG
jgi:hypothetical protein